MVSERRGPPAAGHGWLHLLLTAGMHFPKPTFQGTHCVQLAIHDASGPTAEVVTKTLAWLSIRRSTHCVQKIETSRLLNTFTLTALNKS